MPSNQYTQTIRPQYNSTATGTDMVQHRLIQTTKPQQESIGTETSMNRDTDTQTDQMRYVNRGSNTYSMGNALGIQTDPIISSNRGSNTDLFGNTIAIQTESGGVSNTGTNTHSVQNAMETGEPTYRSQYARQIAAMPMDTTEDNQHVSLPPLAYRQPMFLPPPASLNQQSHPIALPPLAHQQPTFTQPPALIGPEQYLALPPPPQQQLALDHPGGSLAIEYNPRGMKRTNVNNRVDKRKKVLLEDERADAVKRKSENDGGQEKRDLFLIVVKEDN